MLDAAFIREHLEAVKENCRNRNVQADVDAVVRLDDERKRLAQRIQSLQQEQNEQSKLIATKRNQQERQRMVQEGRERREKIASLEKELKQVEVDLRAALFTIPNM